MIFVKSKTTRGFDILYFNDDNGELCDIQQSSSADKSRIWLGVHSSKAEILANKTEQGGTGWVKYPIPEDVMITHRMHLSRKQSILLAFKLLKFGLFNKLN